MRVFKETMRVFKGIIRVFEGIIRVFEGIIRIFEGIIRIFSRTRLGTPLAKIPDPLRLRIGNIQQANKVVPFIDNSDSRGTLCCCPLMISIHLKGAE